MKAGIAPDVGAVCGRARSQMNKSCTVTYRAYIRNSTPFSYRYAMAQDEELSHRTARSLQICRKIVKKLKLAYRFVADASTFRLSLEILFDTDGSEDPILQSRERLSTWDLESRRQLAEVHDANGRLNPLRFLQSTGRFPRNRRSS